MMCGKVSEHLLFIEKTGKNGKKSWEKRRNRRMEKVEKQIKIRRYHICGKMEKNQENERIILTKWHFMLIIKYDV